MKIQRHRNKRIDTHAPPDGFSLVELLVAIMAMALMGSLSVRVMLAADGMNRRAGELDRSVNLLVDAVERMKAESPAIDWEGARLQAMFPDSRVVENENSWHVQVELDEEWHPVQGNASPHYQLSLMLEPDPETGGRTTLLTGRVDGNPIWYGKTSGGEVFDRHLFELEASLPAKCHFGEVAR